MPSEDILAKEEKVDSIVCLVVDDDEDDAFLIDTALKDIPGFVFETRWQPSYEAALEALNTKTYDLCLIDYRIGEIDGITLITEANRRANRVPMILMTGDPDPNLYVKAAAAGAVDFISKDELSSMNLARTIRFVMNQREKVDALEVERARLQEAMDHTRHGIAMFDAGQRLLAGNARYLEIYGFSSDIVRPGIHLDEILRYSISLGNYTDEEAENFVAERLYQVASTQPSAYDQRLRDGRIISVSHTPVSDGGSVTTCDDITEVLASQHRMVALGRSAALAEAVAAAKSKFLANMSHELRTPLNAIIGFTDILRNELFGPLGHPSYREYAEYVGSSAEMLSDIVDQLLEMSLVNNAELELDENDFVPSEAVVQVAETFTDAAARKGLTFRVASNDTHLRLRGDRAKITQAISNVVDNAIKFCRPGGAVVLSLGRSDKDGALVKVSDSGTGIAADRIEALLAPFEQVESAYARLNHGVGLGLPIAIGLIRLHGGDIKIDSQVGVGTTVSIVLPAAQSLASRPLAGSRAAA